MIETTLEKILEQLVILNGGKAEPPAATRTRKPKDEAPAAQPAPPAAAPGITREALGALLVALAKVDMDKAKAILAKFGATKLADVAESDYPAVAQAIATAPQPLATDSLL